jgi:hypothetical protein
LFALFEFLPSLLLLAALLDSDTGADAEIEKII